MSTQDATLRQVIREAQRAGRLGVLGDGAAQILRYLAACCSSAEPRSRGTDHEWWAGHRPSADSFGSDWVDLDNISTSGTAEDARELGAFLAALAELL